ncbi:hypothetical protein TSUD_416800 [Trifolium subterraneum]|uniref:Uncharacterized protein n=1 Tax=Trifolium subterraneum TaxID=3900 RepID=A0A2Z6PLK3_TRISU|nr:hypothetical protein TSUD_416800 [Trifolium subterraneum]
MISLNEKPKIITMASRQQRCNQCGTLLMVPPEIQAFKCSICNGIMHVQSTGPMNQAYNSLNHIAGLFRGFMNTITTSSVINSNSGNYGTTQFGYYLQPQPLRPSYPLIPPSPYGSKRAVLCGICYHGKSYRLKGSINDVKCMKYFLIKEFGFPSDSILMLTDMNIQNLPADDKEERNPLKIPTKYNIQMALRWLIEGSKSGDSLVFHYSGHGTQEMNMNEIDHRYDNAICPVDYAKCPVDYGKCPYTAFDQLKKRVLTNNQNISEKGVSPTSLYASMAFLLGAISKSIATCLTYPAISVPSKLTLPTVKDAKLFRDFLET